MDAQELSLLPLWMVTQFLPQGQAFFVPGIGTSVLPILKANGGPLGKVLGTRPQLDFNMGWHHQQVLVEIDLNKNL